ncbi:PTS glucose transporter subunit IIA [endosymbiont GvMRE of Glomus versiforme]|uniref:PTS glucose transporter subunit IIA n=1 Tax=endosymbiont GvMRE of Glomus versiforme TaxID=2039283 RepID=UPI0011C45F15|nr:PTS glucose transporter subunit IIA [endosymbiont GvMRE of Glomus versiforme]
MKFQINWIRLKSFFLWSINCHTVSLSPPIRSLSIKKKEKSLLGKAYYFFILKDWKVKSPLEGTISKIYPNYALQITNEEGLQILIDIQIDKTTLILPNKIFRCKVKEGQWVSSKTTLFLIYFEKQVISVVVYILWQPEIIERIGELKTNDEDYFVTVYYRNPSNTLLLKRHGKYLADVDN